MWPIISFKPQVEEDFKGGVLIMLHMVEMKTAKRKEKMEFLPEKKRTIEKWSKDVRTEIM